MLYVISLSLPHFLSASSLVLSNKDVKCQKKNTVFLRHLRPFSHVTSCVTTYVCLRSYLHYQASRRQILGYLCAVVASSERWRVVVHVRHIDDNRGDVAEG